MRKLIAISLLLAALASVRAQGTFEAMTVGNSSAGGFVGLAGWSFQTLYPVTLTDLGCAETIITDNGGTIRVGLWAGANLLADHYIAITSPMLLNGTRYEPVTSVVALEPGTTYHLGAYSSSGTIGLNIVGPDMGTYSLAGAIDPASVHRTQNTSGFGAPTTVPGSMSIPAGMNLRYFVPEPSSLGLLALAGLGVLWRRARS